MASTTFAPLGERPRTRRPSSSATLPGFVASARYSFQISSELRVSAFASSHSTTSASRPCFAAQKSVASTATPVGTCTTSVTPGTAFAFAASNDFTVPPNRGGCATRAVSMPGSFTSWVKVALPVTLAGMSRRGTSSFPMRRKADASLSVTFAGTGSFAASATSSPKRADLPEPVWLTTPLATVMSPAGTPQRAAAAATSIARAAAPASRMGWNELRIVLLPPVPIAPPHVALP